MQDQGKNQDATRSRTEIALAVDRVYHSGHLVFEGTDLVTGEPVSLHGYPVNSLELELKRFNDEIKTFKDGSELLVRARISNDHKKLYANGRRTLLAEDGSVEFQELTQRLDSTRSKDQVIDVRVSFEDWRQKLTPRKDAAGRDFVAFDVPNRGGRVVMRGKPLEDFSREFEAIKAAVKPERDQSSLKLDVDFTGTSTTKIVNGKLVTIMEAQGFDFPKQEFSWIIRSLKKSPPDAKIEM